MHKTIIAILLGMILIPSVWAETSGITTIQPASNSAKHEKVKILNRYNDGLTITEATVDNDKVNGCFAKKEC